MKRQYEVLAAEIQALGYNLDHTNSKGARVFAHPDGHEIAVMPKMPEQQARVILGRLRRRCGVQLDTGKRDPLQVKSRAARKRRVEHERLQSSLAKAEAERAAILARKRDRTTERLHAAELDMRLREVDELVEQRRRELGEFEALMVEAPASADHAGRGRPRHTAGER